MLLGSRRYVHHVNAVASAEIPVLPQQLAPVVSEKPIQAMTRDLVIPSKSYPTLGATG
jgi:hypothetical protein